MNREDEATYINPLTGKPETVCVCGHRVGKHVYDYAAEEFGGCPACPDCPSYDRFFERPKD